LEAPIIQPVAQWDLSHAYNILVGKSEGEKPFGRPRSRWENNFRINLRESVGGCGLDSSGSG
jgi:hypothetical protein